MLSLVSGAILSLLLTTSQAQTNFQQILSFGLLPQSGSSPRGQLMEGSDGWLYGTTYTGGTEDSGTIFKINKDGSGFVQIHSFTNAGYPTGGLVEASDGALCGTTSNSGADGSATVFKCNKDGSGFTLLHVFPPPDTTGDGTTPVGSLFRGIDDNLYGTTFGGGAANKGTVFRMSANGANYTNLHSFAGGADGSSPTAGVCQGLDGALYGMTQAGGNHDYGTVFKLDPNTGGCVVLHHFSGGTNDGRAGSGVPVLDSEGLLYGTTYLGGADNVGTMFRVDTNGGSYAVLRSFSLASEGMQPCANLMAGSDSVLYGTTQYGGFDKSGTVFRVNRDGTGYAVLRSFSAIGVDGSRPIAALLLGTDGALYGSTYWGGVYATNGVGGTLFRLSSPVVITAQPLDQTVVAGQNATFSVTATGTLPVSYQWAFNGTPIAGATDGTYTRANVQITDAGSYSVIVSNAVASVTSSNAVLTVTQGTPFQIDSITLTSDCYAWLQASAPPGHYAVEATTDFVAWAELTNITTTGTNFHYIDSAPNLSHRSYRLRRIP